MSEDLIFSVNNQIGLITLNRPKALHALTHEMILLLSQQLNIWNEDPKIHAIVIQSTASRAFCAGGDVRKLYELGLENPDLPLVFFRDEYRLNQQIHQLKKPYIAFMDGLTFGGGVGISLHGSYPIASERFVFAMPETSIGFFPDIGASYLLSKYSALGLYLGLTGAHVDHVLAKKIGLVHAVLPSTQFAACLQDLIELDLSENAPIIIDDCIKRYQYPTENHYKINDLEEISILFDQNNTMLAIINALESSMNSHHRKIAAGLRQKSPISLEVTLELFRRAQNKNLAVCLEMDYTLAYHFMHHPDFYEGVRALLIDKDKSPQWHPKTIEEVCQEQVYSYFLPSLKGLIDVPSRKEPI